MTVFGRLARFGIAKTLRVVLVLIFIAVAGRMFPEEAQAVVDFLLLAFMYIVAAAFAIGAVCVVFQLFGETKDLIEEKRK